MTPASPLTRKLVRDGCPSDAGSKTLSRVLAERKELLEAARLMAEDYQTSPGHHPNHVLVPARAFEALLAAIARAESA